jgi:hypothetical protein
MATVLEVDATGQRRDVVAALAALAAMTVHPSVVAEMGSRVWRRKWLVGLAKAYSSGGGRVRVAKGGRERTCVLSGPTQTRSKFVPRMDQTEYVGPDTAHRWSALQRSSSPIEPEWIDAAGDVLGT